MTSTSVLKSEVTPTDVTVLENRPERRKRRHAFTASRDYKHEVPVILALVRKKLLSSTRRQWTQVSSKLECALLRSMKFT